MTSRTVPAVLGRSARQHGDRSALIIGGHSYTYGELWRRGQQAALALREAGVAAAEPVLVMLPNVIEMVDIWIGLSLLGAVQVPVNTELTGEVLRHQVLTSGARLIVAHESVSPQLSPALTEPGRHRLIGVGDGPLPAGWTSWPECLARQPGPATAASPRFPSVAEHDRLAVMYTSGTTGAAKGVVITHLHAYSYANAVARLLRLRPGDRYFAPLPLFHIAGQWALVYACLQAGATAVVTDRFSASTYWDVVRENEVSATFLLGAMANMLFRQDPRPDDAENPLQRVLMVPLVDDTGKFRERFGAQVCTCYGSTESNVPIISDYAVTDPAEAGRAAPGYSLRIADELDYEVPAGGVGELLVRSDEPWMIATAYQAGGSAAAFRNLWLHTGDAFRRDLQGNYYFVDRVRDYIRRRGENISSADVEREVNAFPGVLESAAVGYPADLGEEDVAVFVVPKAGAPADAAGLLEFLAGRLPRFMVPSQVQVVDELPKTPTGKIRKHELRDRLVPPAA